MDSPSNSPESLSKPNEDWRDNNLFAKVYYHGPWYIFAYFTWDVL